MTGDEHSQIFDDLMRFKPEELTLNGWAVRAGVSRTVWADMRRHGNPSRRTLERLLTAADSSLAEFEALRLGAHAITTREVTGSLADKAGWGWSPARHPSLPLLATSLAGEWGQAGSGIELAAVQWEEVVEMVARPSSLAVDRDAYALTVVGDSMWPRFRPGRRIAVSPRSPIAVGDDVLVRLRPSASSGQILMKALIKRTNDTIELRQFNPDLKFSVDNSQVEAIHKVVGELI